MIKVLLANRTNPPAILWVSEECVQGDQFMWGEDVYQVSAVYSNRFPSCGTTVRKRDRPQPNRCDYAFPLVD